MKTLIPILAWITLSAMASIFFGNELLNEELKPNFLPNDTSHGHYQIELKCDACHTPNMGIKENACIDCHQQDLKDSQDSHPANKFNDPRNFDMVAKLDGRKCITCHSEHVPHTTGKMGVTLPDNYCMECHSEIGEERESHKGLDFQTCATAGCHNYHDNRALYEDFLVKHYGEDDHLHAASEIPLNKKVDKSKAIFEHDSPELPNPQILHDWSSTAHAAAGVNCRACHENEEDKTWSDKVPWQTCQKCHEEESESFQQGRHGMRLSVGLPAMKVGDARLDMKATAAHREVNCVSCHNDHRFSLRTAAMDACLKCHNDEHSLNYKKSPHFTYWRIDSEMGEFNKGVSCASCHMPRVKKHGKVKVDHNQNNNLRPNEKMIRSSCMKCHGLEFSINALADEELIQHNFNRSPQKEIPSLDWAKERE